MKPTLIALSWGHRFPQPGISNEVMAQEILKTKDQFIRILAQIEIGDALSALKLKPDYVAGKPGIYINTYDVIKDMKGWADSKGLDLSKETIRVMCHKMHWPGIRLVLKKLNISAQRINKDIPHDPMSAQWYTRGTSRALLGYCMHALGYIVRKQIL